MQVAGNKSIAFIHPGKAYLPELHAYRAYFESHGFEVEISLARDLQNRRRYDILWYLMGTGNNLNTNAIVVHEYNSLPVSATAVKIFIKKLVNKTPDLRIFLSKTVRDKYNFSAGVPSLIRDMGVHPSFYAEENSSPKNFDFVYSGEMQRAGLRQLIEFFARDYSHRSLLLIGEIPKSLLYILEQAKNIEAPGKCAYAEIPALLAQCSYGLNYVPDKYPWNVQTSTKLLEYCAAGLKVITTAYSWVDEFERAHSARFMKINEDCADLTDANIQNFVFTTPDLREYEWSAVMDRSGILEVLDEMLAKKSKV